MSHRILRNTLFAFAAIVGMQACTDQIGGSIGCPSLCADESAQLRDTILLGAIATDSTLAGFPGLGSGNDVTLLNRGDTADVRLVVRFDSLPHTFLRTGATSDSLIVSVDSAQLIFVVDTAFVPTTAPLTIEAFDVDTTAADTATATLVPLFRNDRLIGSQTYQKGDFTDTLRLSLNNARVFTKIRDTLRLRIGLRVSGPESRRLRVLGSSFSPRIRLRVSPDTLIFPDTVAANSGSPSADVGIAQILKIYPVVAKGRLADPPAAVNAIGGVAGRRTYLRFDIPTAVIDSVQVVRASLLLTQTRARSTGRVAGDSIYVFTQPVLSAPIIADVRTIMSFLGSPYGYGVDSVLFTPADSGLKSIELVNLFRYYKSVGPANSTRSIILRPGREGSYAGELDFFSTKAAANLRPRIRLTYVPRRGFGIP